ncbi:hypothetical protein Misp04_43350 [Micromonospora sp. NBRC 101691]|nr:hypothetical protein Misp04_43350 [Micromonospora sp. NBRC 101691]
MPSLADTTLLGIEVVPLFEQRRPGRWRPDPRRRSEVVVEADASGDADLVGGDAPFEEVRQLLDPALGEAAIWVYLSQKCG